MSSQHNIFAYFLTPSYNGSNIQVYMEKIFTDMIVLPLYNTPVSQGRHFVKKGVLHMLKCGENNFFA